MQSARGLQARLDLANLAQNVDLDKRISLQLAPFTKQCGTRPSTVCDAIASNRPYGLEANRRTLATFLGYSHEQGLADRRYEPEELFAPETLTEVVV